MYKSVMMKELYTIVEWVTYALIGYNIEGIFLLQGAFTGKDIFRDVIPLCEKNFSVMTEVFSNPDQVMAKFVLNIYHLKLQVCLSVYL